MHSEVAKIYAKYLAHEGDLLNMPVKGQLQNGKRTLVLTWLILDKPCKGRFSRDTKALKLHVSLGSQATSQEEEFGANLVFCPDSVEIKDASERDLLANYPFLRVGCFSFMRFCHLKQLLFVGDQMVILPEILRRSEPEMSKQIFLTQYMPPFS